MLTKKALLVEYICVFSRESYKPSAFLLDAELPSIMKTFLQGKLSPFSLLVMLKLATLFLIWVKQIITKDACQNGKKYI